MKRTLENNSESSRNKRKKTNDSDVKSLAKCYEEYNELFKSGRHNQAVNGLLLFEHCDHKQDMALLLKCHVLRLVNGPIFLDRFGYVNYDVKKIFELSAKLYLNEINESSSSLTFLEYKDLVVDLILNLLEVSRKLLNEDKPGQRYTDFIQIAEWLRKNIFFVASRYGEKNRVTIEINVDEFNLVEFIYSLIKKQDNRLDIFKTLNFKNPTVLNYMSVFSNVIPHFSKGHDGKINRDGLLSICDKLIEMNINNNQGIRSLKCKLYYQDFRYTEVIKELNEISKIRDFNYTEMFLYFDCLVQREEYSTVLDKKNVWTPIIKPNALVLDGDISQSDIKTYVSIISSDLIQLINASNILRLNGYPPMKIRYDEATTSTLKYSHQYLKSSSNLDYYNHSIILTIHQIKVHFRLLERCEGRKSAIDFLNRAMVELRYNKRVEAELIKFAIECDLLDSKDVKNIYEPRITELERTAALDDEDADDLRFAKIVYRHLMFFAAKKQAQNNIKIKTLNDINYTDVDIISINSKPK